MYQVIHLLKFPSIVLGTQHTLIWNTVMGNRMAAVDRLNVGSTRLIPSTSNIEQNVVKHNLLVYSITEVSILDCT